MVNDKDIRERISSISETMKITKAMKLVSATILKEARNQLKRTLPYFGRIENAIADILSHDIYSENIYFDRRKGKENRKSAYVIMTGDKGLCGPYNNNIFKYAERYLKRDRDPVLIVCGHSGQEYYGKSDYEIIEDFFYPIYKPTVYRAREMQERIMELFREGRVDNVYLIYTMLKGSFTLKLRARRLLPLTLRAVRKESGAKKKTGGSVDDKLVYEPSIKEVFDVIVPKYIKGILYFALVEAFTSEQCARMTAMESATANAEEILKKLKLAHNRKRQNSITAEISEISAGAEALEG